ncbi:MAG: Xaa-Pro dipeptidase, partial [Steroidobacteraceae bacterium]|nr:Xaa-Pro dipeptidase [Steroidobacteraceae bacterium]
DRCGFDALLIHSGSQRTVFRDDLQYPFRVNALFKALVPLTHAPDCWLLVRPARRPVLIFLREEDYWHQPAELPDEPWVAEFDVKIVGSREAGLRSLPRDLSRCAFLGEPSPGLSALAIRAMNPQPLLLQLEFERAIKTPYELAMLRAANRRGARAHRAAEQAFRAGASEFAIELAFLAAAGQREQDLPYNPIIALNRHAAVLHYQLLEHTPPPERLSMLIDAGTEFAGYACDITRTYAAQAGDFAALVQRMDELQRGLCDLVRPGVDWRDVHVASYERIGRLLGDAGILTCGADEALGSGVTSVFYPHGVGHLLGLQVHDAGGLLANAAGDEIPRPQGHPFLRLTRVLQPGFVVTMEPGIYFIEPLLQRARAGDHAGRIDWRRVAELSPYGGIRIEDDLAVRASGPCENLTRDAFAQMT